ncbi:hypothetical protein ACF3NG_11025 [Aerococcaceae bacterium WGS1372]
MVKYCVTKPNERSIVRKFLLIISIVSIILIAGPKLIQAIDITTDLNENINYDEPYKVFKIAVEPVQGSILDDIDTETTAYPHSEYSIIEAELPSDQVEIHEDTLFSQDELLAFAQTDQLYDYPYFNGELDTFRDLATYINAYLYYSSDLSEHYLVAPMNMTDDIVNFFSYSNLIETQAHDIDHKLRQVYFNEMTDDLIERYQLKAYIPTSIYADAKASMLRAEELYIQIDSTDSDYGLATKALEDARDAFRILTARYNNGQASDMVTINLYVSEELQDDETLEANVETIEEVIHTLPSDVLRRLSHIYILSSLEMPASEVSGFNLHGLAWDNGEVYYIGDEIIYKNLVYHEIGHVVDFASHALMDWTNGEMDAFSTQEDWEEIFEAEWADEASYYNSTLESFAEGFGVYALEYFLGESPDPTAYPNSSLEDRPLTQAYFEELFEALDYE